MRRRRSAASPRQRVAAAAALALAAAAVGGAVLTAVVDPLAGSLTVAGLGTGLRIAWQGALRRGAPRALHMVGALLVMALVLTMLLERRLVAELLIVGAGGALSASSVRVAFAPHGPAGDPWTPVPPPRRPMLFINPRSGGGIAAQLDLAGEARSRGVEPIVIEPGDDLATVVGAAVAAGADALGVAGGDGSVAVVASIAAEHDLPLVCIPAGTRNHFARDAGINRRDVVGAMDAFTDGVERRIDLAEVNGRTFVNNVSLGVYGYAVQHPAYREAKLRTLVRVLPDVVGPRAPSPPLRLTDDLGRCRKDVVVVLVSNNPYAHDRVLGGGTRPRLDGGRLGIIVLGRPGQPNARAWSASTFEIEATTPVPAGTDGEAVTLEPPLRFSTRPAALRLRISARHPGESPSSLLPRRARNTAAQLARIASGRT